jgi:hypothetical protein
MSTILDDSDTSMLSGMDPMDALSLYSSTDRRYRLLFKCGRAEAAQRQRRAGVGEVTDEGYVREVPHEAFASLAQADPDAEVEFLDE